MPATRKKPAAAASLKLGPDLSIASASDAAGELRKRLQPNATLEVDLSSIETIDTIGVQLLLSARMLAASLDAALTYASPSDIVTKHCETLGVTELQFTQTK